MFSVSSFARVFNMPELTESGVLTIRYKPRTKQVCLVDVVCMLCKTDHDSAQSMISTAIDRIGDKQSDLKIDEYVFPDEIDALQVADSITLNVIMMVIPPDPNGHVNAIRIRFSQVLSRYMSGHAMHRKCVSQAEEEFWTSTRITDFFY